MSSVREKVKVLYIRGAPPELSKKLKAAAALNGRGLAAYLIDVLTAHVADLERKGHLPKNRG
jgi:hypothetical protein